MESLDDLEKRVAEARAKRAEQEAKRADDKARADALRELEDLEALEKYEAEHGPEGEAIARVRGRDLTVWLKKPHKNTYDKFAERKDPNAQQVKEFVWPCVLGDKSAVDEAIKAEPHLLYRLASTVAELGGVQRDKINGKS